MSRMLKELSKAIEEDRQEALKAEARAGLFAFAVFVVVMTTFAAIALYTFTSF